MSRRKLTHIILCGLLFLCTGLLKAQNLSEWDFTSVIRDEDEKTPLPNTLEEWNERLRNFGQKIPQEEVFVHMDNNCYFQGDTLYFKAYVRRSDNGRLTNLSHLLYAELWNHDGFLVERQWVELKNGQGHGSFVLADTLYSGFYELRAYTRWQLNWGEYQHPHYSNDERMFLSVKMAKEYYRDYEKLYSRVFPLYDKPSAPGQYVQQMNNMRNMQRRFKKQEPASPIVTSFFPEGGALTADADVRVAFETARKNGEHISGRIVLLDSKDHEIATAKTENRGRGILSFHCQAGETYHTLFTTEDGEQVKTSLPDPEKDGCALSLGNKEGVVSITLQPRGSAADETLGITVISNGLHKLFRKLPPQASTTITLNDNELPTGVSQVTVFNSQGRVYADRLFFVRHDDLQDSNLSVTAGDSVFEAFQPITLQLDNPRAANANISLSIRDKANSTHTHDNGNILTEMLLCSQIRGFVEDPGYYFESDDAMHRLHLDLLMMVQGWRRYNWLQMTTPNLFRINHPYEKMPILYGSVNRYQTVGKDGFYGWQGDNYVQQQPDYFQYPHSRSRILPEGAIPVLGLASEERELFLKYCHLSRKEDPDNPSNWNYTGPGYIKRDVLVHTEFTHDDLSYNVFGEERTKKGRFRIEVPRCYWPFKMFLSASDSSKWGRRSLIDLVEQRRMAKIIKKNIKPSLLRPQYQWIVPREDVYPEFYVRLMPYNPRYVKPYNYYQLMGNAMRKQNHDGLKSGLTRIDFDQPALVVDAYKAFNDASDAGLIPAWYGGFFNAMWWLDKLYMANMGMPNRHNMDNLRQPAAPISGYKRSPKENSALYQAFRQDLAPTAQVKEDIHYLQHMRNYKLYTDYSPRMEGWDGYEQENRPHTSIDGEMLTDFVRPTYRDRYYVMPGIAVPYKFYQPDYSQRPLPDVKDYRRTLYWNPDLQLDKEGKAKVTFYNNSQQTRIDIEAEGISPKGMLITHND